MRGTRLFAICCASLIVVAPANAQQSPPAQATAPTRTVDDYVCAFAGECGKQPDADNSIAAPTSRGFRLSVPERRTGTAPAPDSTAMPNASRSNVAGGTAHRRPAVTNRSRASATETRRMDLRVSFLLNSAQLTTQAQEEAKVFAKALLLPELATKRFRIEGHTDSSGSRALNMDLSKRRAQAVADYLASLGVQSDRLEVHGYGPDRPLPGHNPSAPDNRRVEAQLL
jgi:outer membrane protein OmpA-like peptidoglycan-associated protein